MEPVSTFQVGWEQVAGILGAIVLFGNAWAAAAKWIAPALKVKKDVEEIKDEITQMKIHEKNDLAAIQSLEQMNRLQCRAMICILNHMIDGNGVEKMKKTRDSIQDLFVEQ